MNNQSKRFFFPFFLIGIMFLCIIPFQACEKEDDECTCDSCNHCDTCFVVYKPNIYIYPTENCSVTVTLSFPKGGEVITSIPDYAAGWNFYINPEGIINNQYQYLFYESVQPDVWQMEKGWTVRQEELGSFFTLNLTEYGFYGREIDDFIKYWIPRLTSNAYYEIYPQESDLINTVIDLDIVPPPVQLLRLFYVFRGVNENANSLVVPEINSNFSRTGFFVTEWGVILK